MQSLAIKNIFSYGFILFVKFDGDDDNDDDDANDDDDDDDD